MSLRRPAAPAPSAQPSRLHAVLQVGAPPNARDAATDYRRNPPQDVSEVEKRTVTIQAEELIRLRSEIQKLEEGWDRCTERVQTLERAGRKALERIEQADSALVAEQTKLREAYDELAEVTDLVAKLQLKLASSERKLQECAADCAK